MQKEYCISTKTFMDPDSNLYCPPVQSDLNTFLVHACSEMRLQWDGYSKCVPDSELPSHSVHTSFSPPYCNASQKFCAAAQTCVDSDLECPPSEKWCEWDTSRAVSTGYHFCEALDKCLPPGQECKTPVQSAYACKKTA